EAGARSAFTALLLHPGEERNIPSGRALPLLMNKPDGSSFTRAIKQLWRRPSPCSAVGIHNTRMHRESRGGMKRNEVALELDDAFRLSNAWCRRLAYLKLNDFAFTDIALKCDETLILRHKIFEDAGASQLQNRLTPAFADGCLSSSTELRALNRLDKMALLIACLCHDLDHRGTDNKFQKVTLSPLAQLYSSSMLERHHFNQCIMLLSISGCDILSPLTQPQYECCIETIEKCILATDLESTFKKQIRQIIDTGSFDISCPEHADILYGLLMTAADLSAITKPWNVQYKTAHLDLKDRDKRMRLPAMQVGFIDFVCQPVYTMLCELCTGLESLRDGCQTNRKQWDSLIDRSSAEGVRG
uniref:PDEase domain-containing protein n=1 Tax=Macrostomum lignano TaxID=282301 RepID=A0A1I8FE52_9PLAT